MSNSLQSAAICCAVPNSLSQTCDLALLHLFPSFRFEKLHCGGCTQCNIADSNSIVGGGSCCTLCLETLFTTTEPGLNSFSLTRNHEVLTAKASFASKCSLNILLIKLHPLIEMLCDVVYCKQFYC
ncbi:hypothetical protein CHARACLAT_024473 [Characodon lateralis]|uniref:Uncharacterized protein n=1 Tax=Characodon lateralis TaxID=208331 RepID=A0ABU7EM50_9TELE|nr:hypothetical protein [Characodon lateralis]